MKTKPYLFLSFLFFLIIILSESCSSRLENYDDGMISEIKKIKRNKKFIYLEHEIPNSNLDRKKLMEYLNKPTKLVFKKTDFENNEMTFALAGRSTLNFGYLNFLENQKLIALDSAACNYGDFLFLKLKPIRKGEYKIRNSGCRYYNEFEITIK